MALRKGHGNGAGVPRIEVLPPDELPEGVPADPDDERDTDRRRDGKFAKGNSCASKGGRSRKGQVKLARELGIARLADASDFKPYKRLAKSFAKAQRGALAASVGGGVCGPGPSSMVASAALQLAASRYLSDRAAAENDPALFTQASRLADASRQNLLAAHELCAREAKGRPQVDPAARIRAQIAAVAEARAAEAQQAEQTPELPEGGKDCDP